jgi:hypothetical protein
MFQADLLQDKVILVTGGGTGLGRAMGERFLELGAKLAICGRRQEVAVQAASEMARSAGGVMFATRCVVRQPDQGEERRRRRAKCELISKTCLLSKGQWRSSWPKDQRGRISSSKSSCIHRWIVTYKPPYILRDNYKKQPTLQRITKKQ